MASFVKKTLLLAVYLVCFIHLDVALAATSLRQSRAVPHTLVTGIPVAQGTAVPRRCEIRNCIKDSTWLNIFLLGLQCLQTTDTSQLLSFYRLSGIHGTNYQWDGDTNGGTSTQYGYCHHGDRLFPPWHRPYLSLYEKALLDCANKTVQTFPAGSEKDNHITSLKTWRLPYWDWAMNPNLADVMGATTSSQTVVVRTVQSGAMKSVTMQNPLYSYVFQISKDQNTYAGGTPWPSSTVRYPKKVNKVLVTQPATVVNSMLQAGPGLKSSVYNALTMNQGYNLFSNMADGSNSLESPHGNVHGTVGGTNGHMSYVPVAAFDPIFWLHHANVDRLFAIWQAIFPTQYLPTTSSNGAPNQDTPLYPFRITENQYWTPQLARDTKAFGYTYPETDNASPTSATQAVNALYGSNSGTSLNQKRKRDLYTTNDTSTEEDTYKIRPITYSATYIVYHVRIKISNAAVYGSFTVNIFLGEPSYDETDFPMDPNYVGSFNVFTAAGLPKSHKKIVQGTVCMTTALYKLVAAEKLKDMKPTTVKAYVKDNFKWILTGQSSDGYDLDGLDISVVKAKVTLPKDEYSLPVWGEFSTVYKVV